MVRRESATTVKKVKQVQRHAKDVGSPEVQVAILTERITQLTEHLKTHPHDNHSRRGLLQMVGKRKKHLAYLKKTDPEARAKLVKQLGIRG